MNWKAREVKGVSVWLLAVALCSVVAGACAAATPKPEIFDQEVVEIRVDYEHRRIIVEPESARIYFQWRSREHDALKPVQVRWVVKGLRRGHTIHVTPKEGSPKVQFPYPSRYRGRPAYSIDGRHNSIVTGQVEGIPGLVKDKGYTEEHRASRRNGEPYEVVWRYDITVADEKGDALFEVDPEIVVAGHPPCC